MIYERITTKKSKIKQISRLNREKERREEHNGKKRLMQFRSSAAQLTTEMVQAPWKK